jgi:hypothetical protein
MNLRRAILSTAAMAAVLSITSARAEDAPTSKQVRTASDPKSRNKIPPQTKEAMEAIEKLGGEVHISISKGEVSTRVELNSFREEPDFKTWRGSDAELSLLAKLPRVESIWLQSRSNSDAGLAHFSDLRDLTRLNLSFTPIGDLGVSYLKPLPKLEYLDLSNTRISDAALASVAAMRALQQLDLSSTRVTDAGLGHLKGHRSLIKITLSDTEVSDKGLQYLMTIPSLTTLDLSDTTITDKGLASLKAGASLKSINLSNTIVTDRGCRSLQEITRLERVNLDSTCVTREGAALILSKHPKAAVHFSTRVSADDEAAIRKLIEATPDIDHRILDIGPVTEAGTVEVMTGIVRGPLDGGGDSLRLQKVGGHWKIVSRGFWVS